MNKNNVGRNNRCELRKSRAEQEQPSAKFDPTNKHFMPVPVAARSKAQVYGRAPAEIVGSNPTRGMDVCLL